MWDVTATTVSVKNFKQAVYTSIQSPQCLPYTQDQVQTLEQGLKDQHGVTLGCLALAHYIAATMVVF
jgi:hypothetical protein